MLSNLLTLKCFQNRHFFPIMNNNVVDFEKNTADNNKNLEDFGKISSCTNSTTQSKRIRLEGFYLHKMFQVILPFSAFREILSYKMTVYYIFKTHFYGIYGMVLFVQSVYFQKYQATTILNRSSMQCHPLERSGLRQESAKSLTEHFASRVSQSVVPMAKCRVEVQG